MDSGQKISQPNVEENQGVKEQGVQTDITISPFELDPAIIAQNIYNQQLVGNFGDLSQQQQNMGMQQEMGMLQPPQMENGMVWWNGNQCQQLQQFECHAVTGPSLFMAQNGGQSLRLLKISRDVVVNNQPVASVVTSAANKQSRQDKQNKESPERVSQASKGKSSNKQPHQVAELDAEQRNNELHMDCQPVNEGKELRNYEQQLGRGQENGKDQIILPQVGQEIVQQNGNEQLDQIRNQGTQDGEQPSTEAQLAQLGLSLLNPEVFDKNCPRRKNQLVEAKQIQTPQKDQLQTSQSPQLDEPQTICFVRQRSSRTIKKPRRLRYLEELESAQQRVRDKKQSKKVERKVGKVTDETKPKVNAMFSRRKKERSNHVIEDDKLNKAAPKTQENEMKGDKESGSSLVAQTRRRSLSELISCKKPRLTKQEVDLVRGYNRITCHFCCQKDNREKVVCTNKNCQGPVAFCRRCLLNRHGEDMDQAIASGCWVCPRCRGNCGEGCVSCCNCANCRKRLGLQPTGKIHRQFFSVGFDNAHDYLIYLNTKEDPKKIAARKWQFKWGDFLRYGVISAMKQHYQENEEDGDKQDEIVQDKLQDNQQNGNQNAVNQLNDLMDTNQNNQESAQGWQESLNKDAPEQVCEVVETRQNSDELELCFPDL